MAQEKLPLGQPIVLACGFRDGQKAVLVIKGHCEELGPLRSVHEEADARLPLHAKHASHDHKRIIIQSPDTDVAVLCATHFNSLACQQLWFRTGVKDKLMYVRNLAAELGPQLCDTLPAFHALTGCDSNSSLCGIGKKKAFNTICASELHQECVSAGQRHHNE